MIQAIILILVITLGIGLPLTFVIIPKHNTIGRFGLSYLLGVGITTLTIYVTNLLGFKLTTVNCILTALVLGLSLSIVKRKKMIGYWKEARSFTKNFHPDMLEKVTIWITGFFVTSSFVNTFYWPVYIWDALTLYDFRAKLFVQSGVISDALQSLNGYYLGYPLLTSLSHTMVYLFGGDNPQFLYSLFYLSLGFVFYGLLRDIVSRKLSLVFVLMLLSIPQIFKQSLVAYTNIPYIAYFSLGTIYFYLWDKKRTSGYLLLSGTMIGLATWTRSSEPYWLAILMIVISYSVYRKRFLDVLIFSVAFFPIQQAWKIFQNSLSSDQLVLSRISSSTFTFASIFNLSHWQEIITFLYKYVFVTWGPIFILFVIAFLVALKYKNIRKNLSMFVITLFLLAFFIVGTFIFSYTFSTWNEIPDSASRTAMIFYPLFVYNIAIVFGFLVKSGKKQQIKWLK